MTKRSPLALARKLVNRFDIFTKQLMDETKERQKHTFPIFHFTSLDAAASILSNQTLRFTRAIGHPRDNGELTAGLDIGFDCLDKLCLSRSRASKLFISKFEDALRRGFVKRFFVGICCFRDESESENHWKEYADNHRGTKIGFRSADIATPSNARVYPFKMHYDEEQIRSVFERMLPEAQDVLESQIVGQLDRSAIGEFLEGFAVKVALCLVEHSFQFKVKKYSCEREVRLMLIFDRTQQPPDFVQRSDRGEYVELPIQRDASGAFAIHSVQVGRCAPISAEMRLNELTGPMGIQVTRKFGN